MQMKKCFGIVLTAAVCLAVSCTTEKESKDAAFWRMKYEALDSFVKKKGLDAEAEKAVLEYEQHRSPYRFTVFKDGYALNGKSINKDALQAAIKNMSCPKSQRIEIMAMAEVSYEDILLLMNELNLNGFKNFNLISEKNAQTIPYDPAQPVVPNNH